MDDRTKLSRSDWYKDLNFRGTSDWTIDLNGYGSAADKNDDDGEAGIEPCETGNPYDTLEDLEAAVDSIPCRTLCRWRPGKTVE